MTASDTALGDLAGLRDRLVGGIYGSISATRRPGHEKCDEEALRALLPEKFAALRGIHEDTWNPRGEPFTTITGLAADLRKNRELRDAVVFSPHLLLDFLICLRASPRTGLSGEELLSDCWLMMCWIAEAAWTVIAGEPQADAGSGSGGARLLRPAAARMRFLVLAEPMRFRGRTGGTAWGTDQDLYAGSGVFDNTFGLDSWTDLVGRCRDARREWQDCLDTFRSHPLLRNARAEELEQELRTLVFRDGRAEPMVLSVTPLSARVPLAPEDAAAVADAVERHLLPRFAMATVARLGLYDEDPFRQRARRLFALAVIVTGIAAVGCAAGLQVHPAVWLAAACYALICTGVVVLPGSWGAMWLLRMPAASAVGIFALTPFMPGGWLRNPPGGWTAAGVLTAVSFGYLLVEARNHGVARRSAVPRALFVVITGAVHAVMVSLIGLVVVAPALVANGGQMREIWSESGYGHAGVVLALAAAWCLTVGVFLQILWDERPITAPLAHLSWRR